MRQKILTKEGNGIFKVELLKCTESMTTNEFMLFDQVNVWVLQCKDYDISLKLNVNFLKGTSSKARGLY